MLTKLKSLIATATELPGALRECVELAREANGRVADARIFANAAIDRANERDELAEKLAKSEGNLTNALTRLHNATGRANEATDALSEWQGWAMSKAGSIACSADVELRELIDSTLADAEHSLAREVEARRQRRMAGGCGEAPPLTTSVLFRIDNGPVQYGTVPIPYGTAVEWRYLSPEDMP